MKRPLSSPGAATADAGGEEPAILEPGSELAPGYAVVEHLRRGSRLDVYDVWSAERSCHCVAKTLRPDRAGDRSARSGVRSEATLLLGCTHPHLVRAYELVAAPVPVLILETITGPTLEQVLELEQRLARDDLVHLGLQVASALRYLHGRGTLHRDVKPSNIVSERGAVRLIDLSVACRVGHRSRGGTGTRGYMAPEQERGGVMTPAVDVWSLGAVLYEAATGVPVGAYADAGGAGEIEPVRRRRRLPLLLARLIDDCLSPRPEGRPSVDAVVETLLAAARSA